MEAPGAAAVLLWSTMVAHATTAAVGRASRGMRTHLLPKYYDFHHCTDKPHHLIIRNFTFFLDKLGAQFADVDFDLTEPTTRMTGYAQFRVMIHRCSPGSASECEYFNTWSWNMPVCGLIYADHMLWTPLVHNLHPAFKCPIQRGRFHGRNLTLDFDSLEKAMAGLNLEKYAWPIKVMIDNERGMYLCFDFVAEVRRVRVREH